MNKFSKNNLRLFENLGIFSLGAFYNPFYLNVYFNKSLLFVEFRSENEADKAEF